MKTKMPKKVIVFVCDYQEGKPILAVATRLNEIPNDCDGEVVGSYDLIAEQKFVVTRDLQ